MRYTTYNDISNTLRRNLHRLPPLSLVVGVPRSGMIPALMLSELLNIPCASLDDFIAGREMSCGGRRMFMQHDKKDGSVLVLDDTVYKGTSMRQVRSLLQPMHRRYNIILGCVYAEGKDAAQMVDFCFENVYDPGERLNLYEWNILHHYPVVTEASMWDIDGLVCQNPPDDRDTEAYEHYLPNARAMIIPTTRVGAFVTYRLEKYRTVTENWLRQQGIEYGQLIMFDARNARIRNSMMSPAKYKAQIYGSTAWAELFLESDAYQAKTINKLCGKPVYCYEDGRMYGHAQPLPVGRS